MTEDADLGLRLRRHGYRTGIIWAPTKEDGPEDLKTWLPQRTRWFKGWIQTWLVHMRNPRRLAGELGFASFVSAQILFAGMIVSALVHPVFLVTVVSDCVRLAFVGATAAEAAFASFALAHILAGYAAFVALGLRTLDQDERKGAWRAVLATPLHWMLLSAAAWLAIWELYRHPHRWNKTPHRPARRPERKREKAGPIPAPLPAPR